MKYIKKYENDRIDDGDYIIVDPKNEIYMNWKEFVKNNVGKIISSYYVDRHLIYIVDFDSGIGDGHRRYSSREIIAHSKNKNELETILSANKYNI
jgi:hypothetical protein